MMELIEPHLVLGKLDQILINSITCRFMNFVNPLVDFDIKPLVDLEICTS